MRVTDETRLGLSCALGLGVSLRALWVLFTPRVVAWDAASYVALARALATTGRYGASGRASAFFMPGWPLWMSLFDRLGLGASGVVVGNVALGAATIVATHALARELDGIRAAGFAAAIVAGLPSLVTLPGLLLSENLALPLVVFAVLLLVQADREGSWPRWVAAALVCAASAWAREANVALGVAGVVVALLGRRRGPARAALFALVFALALAPWVVRNRAAVGEATLSTSESVNLCIGLGPGATGGYRTLPWFERTLEIDADDRAVDGAAWTCVRDGLAARPASVVTLAPARLSRFAAFDDWEVDEFFSRGLPPEVTAPLRWGSNAAYWGLLVLAWLAVARGTRPRVLVATIAAVTLSVLVSFGVGRFHAPLLPLLAVVAASRGPPNPSASAPGPSSRASRAAGDA